MSIQWSVETFECVQSTQSVAKERAEQGAQEGLVIQALEQTSGQGRHGREWVSPEGNLYLSVLLRPKCMPAQAAQLSFVAALAVSDSIDDYIDDTSLRLLKWPNDVLLDGKKCAGILLETELGSDDKVKYLVLGIGVNIVSAPRDVGVALQGYTRVIPAQAGIYSNYDKDPGLRRDDEEAESSLNSFRTNLLAHLSTHLELWRTKGFGEVRRLWLEQAHKPGTKLQIKLGEKLEEGYFHDIDDDGNLLLSGESDDIRKISAGDVFIR